MRRAAFIYNPAAGSRREKRRDAVEAAARVFELNGVRAELIPTRAPGSAGPQALEAIRAGCDAIICCGGDGTVHDAMQSLVPARSTVPVGVIPLGTGNGLAAELRIPRRPAPAAKALLAFEPRRIPVGLVETARPGQPPSIALDTRYFLISAGVGADAEMLYHLDTETKNRYGLRAYYWHAVRLFLSHRFMPFEVEYRETSTPVMGDTRHAASPHHQPQRAIVAQVLAGRIERFGGLVSRLTPGASLEAPEMRLVLFRSPLRAPMLHHAVNAVLRRAARHPQIDIVSATDVTCRPLADPAALPAAWARANLASRAYAQADGELLGTLPVRMTIVPDALTLLMPRNPIV